MISSTGILVLAIAFQIGAIDGDMSTYTNYDPGSYKYSYGVSDPSTGDHKSQWEKRENGVVRGAYSLLEADGTTRLVEYTADHTGFHPVVRKLGTPTVGAAGYLRPTYNNQRYHSVGYDGRNDRNYPNTRYSVGYNYDDAQHLSPPLSLRQQRPVPLLNTAYHGYDNLYH